MFSKTARFEGYQNVYPLNVTNHAVRNATVLYLIISRITLILAPAKIPKCQCDTLDIPLDIGRI